MPFDRRIFRYPAVEYIPLYPLTLALEPAWKPPDDRVLLYVFFRQGLSAAGTSASWHSIDHTGGFQPKVGFADPGYQVTSAYYRGYTTILQGESLSGGYHIAAIPRGYFYKNRVHFVLYDNNATKLGWANISLQKY